MAASRKPSIILCAGAWLTEYHVKPSIPHFETAGYRFIPRPLNSAGNPGVWDDDVDVIQSAISHELNAGNDVCLIIHSAAGISACEAVNRIFFDQNDFFAGNIIRIIFVASFVDWEEIATDHFRRGFMSLDFEKGISKYLRPYQGFYNDMSEEDAKPFCDALVYQTAQFHLRLSSDEWTNVPLTYLECTRDRSVPLRYQKRIANYYGMQEVEIEAGHCPFTSQPEKFVNAIDGILAAQ